MYKHISGDKVVVRADLNEGKTYRMEHSGSENDVCSSMLEFRGQVVTISYTAEGQYRIKEDGGMWLWTDEMFL